MTHEKQGESAYHINCESFVIFTGLQGVKRATKKILPTSELINVINPSPAICFRRKEDGRWINDTKPACR
jgi:hypothetical protein